VAVASSLLAVAAPAAAGPSALDDACRYVRETLEATRAGEVTAEAGRFSWQGRSYERCMVTLLGDTRSFPDPSLPPALLYPAEGSAAYRAGWRLVLQTGADGPDGTRFRMEKGGVSCMVRGTWDGGDDSDPEAPRSTRFSTLVGCAGIGEPTPGDGDGSRAP